MRWCNVRQCFKLVGLVIYAVVVFNIGLSYHGSKVSKEYVTSEIQGQTSNHLRRSEDDFKDPDQPSNRHKDSDIVNLSDPLDRIVHNPAVVQNARKIIHVARVLVGQGQNQDQGQKHVPGVIPQNSTVEFDPDKGDIVLPGGIYQDLDFKHKWERRKIPEDVVLTAKLEQTVEDIIEQFAAKQNELKETRKEKGVNIYKHKLLRKLAPWEKWHNGITQYNLYQAEDQNVEEVIQDMRTAKFEEMYEHTGGTQLKLVFTLENGARVMFKPMRFPRNVETLPDHFVFSDYERHIAEIAAFNLDRILDFRRVPPTTGRRISVTQIRELAPRDLEKTFFTSPAGNKCLYGSCSYYCDSGHAVCGKPDLLEGSMMAYLPSSKIMHRQSFQHPWKRSYSKHNTHAAWEGDADYCRKVRQTPPYDSGRRMADLMDLAVFDFLQGNIDRHNFQIFERYGNFTFNLHYDNGRGFGKSYYDDMLILAPISQCCLFRYSTLVKLWRFYKGPEPLSRLMRAAMATDPVAPVLIERHLVALDRRVKIILQTLFKCIQQKDAEDVIIVDGF